MWAFLKVLGVHDMNFEFWVATDAHRSHEISFSLHSIFKLELNFILLTGMIDDISHDFFLSLKEFIASIDVLHDEFFNRYFTVIVYIDLVKYFVDHLISHFFIIYLLLIPEENVKLLFCNIAIMVDIN